MATLDMASSPENAPQVAPARPAQDGMPAPLSRHMPTELPNDEIALAVTLLTGTEAAERARIRALEAVVIGLALGCLYFLLVSPIGRPLTVGDLMVVGSLAVAALSFFAFYRATAQAHGEIVQRAQVQLRRAIAERKAGERPDAVEHARA